MTSLADMTPFPPPVHPYMPWVILHIAAGCFAIVAGYTAVIAVKGERLHRLAGTVFVAAMLILASVGVYLSVMLQGQLPGETSNIAGGGLAFYLVLTAYMTVKSPEGTIGTFEKSLFVMPLCFGAMFFFWGFKAESSPKHAFDGYHPSMFFIFAVLSVFFAALDLRVLAKGGLTGAARIARHVWRMCFAFFFAAGSFFLGQQKVMPVWMHGSKALLVLGLAPLGFMLFWMVRVRIGNRFKTLPPPKVQLESV
jgi:uncharacterized membrane protein